MLISNNTMRDDAAIHQTRHRSCALDNGQNGFMAGMLTLSMWSDQRAQDAIKRTETYKQIQTLSDR